MELQKRLTENYNFIFDPRYDDLFDLCENINSAKLVVSVDTGTLHLSEILSTPWIALLTNNHKDIITKNYVHGVDVISSNIGCSPCNLHGAACVRNKTNSTFDCIYGFSSLDIYKKIINYLKLT